MAEEQKPDLSKVDTSGFLNRALDATPKWALGLIGAGFGGTLCLIAALTLGGLQGPVVRLANAAATRFERTTESLVEVTGRLQAITERLTRADERLTATEAGVARLDMRVQRLDDRVSEIEKRHKTNPHP